MRLSHLNPFDALGQVKTKKLAPEYNNDAGLETLDYDYNIRGWLLGANRNYISVTATTPNDKHFGFDLGYDKKGNLPLSPPEVCSPVTHSNLIRRQGTDCCVGGTKR